MFQELLNIEGIWVQHRVSPEPVNLLLWNFHRMLLIYKTFIWTNNNKNSHVTFCGHFEAILKYEKNAYKQLFYAKTIKHPSTPCIIHYNLFRYYIVYLEINQNMTVEGLNCVLYVIPLDMFLLFWFPRNLMTLQIFFCKIHSCTENCSIFHIR